MTTDNGQRGMEWDAVFFRLKHAANCPIRGLAIRRMVPEKCNCGSAAAIETLLSAFARAADERMRELEAALEGWQKWAEDGGCDLDEYEEGNLFRAGDAALRKGEGA